MNLPMWWRAIQRIVCSPAAYAIVLVVFWACAMRNLEAPGLYMDAINPDYLVARWLNPELQNMAWVLPGPRLPLRGNLYHGTQTMWIGLLTYGLLGTSVASARITHALFGAVIVMFVCLILRRTTRRPWLALVVSAALATDMAFLGSFRTQAYIILAGEMWLMAAFYLAIRTAQSDAPRHGLVLLSGVATGLAAYGYFIFLFFALPVAALAILGPGRTSAMRRAAWWGAGFAIGMLPYVIGYVLLGVAEGGWGPFVEWMRRALAGLKPTDGSPSYLEGMVAAFRNSRLALTGAGNEIMMNGGASIDSTWAKWRLLFVTLAGLVCLGAGVSNWNSDRRFAKVLLASVGLPMAFLAIAAWFGSRMWAHHFTSLIAIGYVLVGLAAGGALTRVRSGMPARIAAGVFVLGAVLWLSGNMVQQNRVHARLAATGGAGLSTDALSVMAREALSERTETVWCFPDWGFFMPFVFLTGNQVSYEIEASPAALERHRGSRQQVKLAFWKEADREQYETFLRENGVQEVSHRVLTTRDGQPAVHLLVGRLPAMEEDANATE